MNFLAFLLALQYMVEGTRIRADLQSSLNQLNKTKEKYEKAFGASERALDAYKKADDDINLSRAEVEKQRVNSTIKTQQESLVEQIQNINNDVPQ